MRDVFVEHYAIQDATLLNFTSRNLLHACVPLNVNSLESALVLGDGSDGLEGEFAHEVGPTHDKLGADRGLDEGEHLLVVVNVDGDRYTLDDLEGLLECFVVRGDDDDRVDVPLEL